MARPGTTAFALRIARLALLAAALLPAAGWARPGDGFAPDSAVTNALREAFGGGGAARVTVSYAPVVLDSARMASIATSTHSPFVDDTLRLFECRRDGRIAGYGVMDNVRGKSREITYLVALDTAGAVARLDVLVYRESHGGEVSNPAFREQFVGKKPGDRLAPGRDIRTISGATISSRSLTAGVAKVLAAFGAARGGR